MGTHRSKHNKGRKPLYKEHRLVAARILENPYWPKGHMFADQMEFNRNYDWSNTDIFKLEVLADADAPIEGAAEVFARGKGAVAWKARQLGIILPSEWSRLIAPKYKPRQRQLKEPLLSYPFIKAPRPEHADLLAINAVIPRGIPDHMRGDIGQEIMVAILEGRTTLAELQAANRPATYYIKKFWTDNYEDGGHAISFQDTDDEWDSDAVASSIAAKEWHRTRFAERTRFGDSLRTFTPPTQIEAVYEGQLRKHQLDFEKIGQFLDRDEVEEMLSDH